MKNLSAFHPDECGFSAHIPSDKYVIIQASACVVYVLLSIPTVLLNAISIFTIQKCSQLKAKVCYFTILIQSAIDLTAGVISLPLQTAHILLKDVFHVENKVICWLNFTISYFLISLSVLTLCALSFDRYMGVVHPITHRNQVTKGRIAKYECCAGLLILVVIFSMPESVSDIIELMFMLAEALISLVFLVYAYTRIFITARNSLFSANRPGDAAAQPDMSEMKRKRRFRRELKLAKCCFMVVCTFALCYLPLMVLLLTINVLNAETAEMLWSWALCLSFLNCTLNSIIFFWSNAMLRKEAIKVLKKAVGCS